MPSLIGVNQAGRMPPRLKSRGPIEAAGGVRVEQAVKRLPRLKAEAPLKPSGTPGFPTPHPSSAKKPRPH